METTEIRVRPVIRHAITRFVAGQHADGMSYGSSECLGEFSHESYAEEVAQAMREKVAMREYALVEETPGTMNPAVFYAYSEEEVARFLAEPKDGKGWKVYSRIMPTLKY